MKLATDFVEAAADFGDVLARRSPASRPYHEVQGLVSAGAEDEMAPTARRSLNGVAPIWRVRDQELARPVIVRIVSDAGDVVISSAVLRIWGSGQDAHEAVRDFIRTFSEVLRSYEETPDDELTATAKEYRKLLQGYFA